MSDPQYPVPVPQPDPACPVGQADTLMSQLDDPFGRIRTNLDPANETHLTPLAKLLEPAELGLADYGGKDFRLMAYMAEKAQITLSDTGEVVDRVRVTLLDDEGHTMSWSSPITTQKFLLQLSVIVRVRGNGPWQPPVTIHFVPQKGTKQGYWYSVRVVDYGKPAQKGGKK